MGFFLATPEMHPPFSFLGALAYSFFYNLVSSLWEESMPYTQLIGLGALSYITEYVMFNNCWVNELANIIEFHKFCFILWKGVLVYNLCACVCMCVSVCVYIYIYTYTYIYIYIYIYMGGGFCEFKKLIPESQP